MSGPEPDKPYRLGILGCGGIAARAVLEPLAYVSGLRVVAVANRTRAKAERLASIYSIPRIYESLDALLQDPQIDAVYIALSNELHTEWAIRALAAGKHVLVEKPIGLTPEDVQLLRKAKAAAPHLKLVEGMMVSFHPWQAALKWIIDSYSYGRMLRIESRISIPAKDRYAGNYRSVKAKGGGAFADLGCYWLQFLQSLTGLQAEERRGISDFNGPDGCDWTLRAAIRLPGGIEAVCTTSFDMPYKASHKIHLEEGCVIVPDFFRPNIGFYKMKIRLEHSADPTVLQEFEPMNYYVNQLMAFIEIMNGDREERLHEAFERIILQQAILADAENRYRQSLSRGAQA